MRVKLFLVTFLIGLFFSFSQELQITGSIKDANNKPIAFANIIIKTLDEESDFITGTTSDEQGFFNFNNLIPNTYTIEISYLGLKTANIELGLKKNTTLDTIILVEDTQELDGVTITAKRPTIKRLVDRLVFNVENSTLSNNNVLDVLKHTPGVIVTDGKISVKQSIPTIYINDRKVHLSVNEIQQLLEGTTASNLKSIEVITNPPAKYEAEGGSVINIVMAKNLIAGYNGSIFGNYKQGYQYPKYSFGTSHFFKAKKLNSYVNYNISPKKDYIFNKEFINFFDANNNLENKTVSFWETDYNRFKESSNQNISSNIDYEIDNKNTVGLSTSILVSPRKNTKANVDSYTEVFNFNKTLDSTFKSLNRSVKEIFNLAFSLDYKHRLNRDGEILSLNFHHTYYDSSNFQDVITSYFFPDQSLIRDNKYQTFSSQVIKLYTGQVDFKLPIDDSSEFETGGKVSNINSESILNQFIFVNSSIEIDPENSNIFKYDENNYALYASFSKDWDTWSLKAGLRAEYTEVKGNSITTGQLNKNNYTKFFPSFYVLNKINDDNEIYINYNRRIYRPRYDQLNPFKFFLNDNSLITGDPNLKPQVDDQFILGYTFKQKYTFEAYYRFEDNPTIQMILQNNDDQQIIYKNTNINQSISYGLDFITYTNLLKYWGIYVVSSIYYYENKFLAIESNNLPFTTDRWNLYAEINNYFSFLNDRSLISDLTFRYISPIVYGPSLSSESYSLDLTLKKNLWNNRASLSIGVTDIFNMSNVNTTTRYLNQDTFYTSNRENRLFIFGFNYKFGNYRLGVNKKNINLDERDRLLKD